MQIRDPPFDDRETIREELLLPSFREAERLDPSFSELDEAALDAAGCGYWLDHDDRALFVAEVDGQPAGFVSVSRAESPPVFERGPRAHIDGLYVRPEHRREGVASRLLDRVEAWAATEGCDHLGVSVHEANEAARRLYERRFSLTFLSYRRPVGPDRRSETDQ